MILVGLGRNISFPVSSQDILKSLRTSRALDVIIDPAITLLWTPRSRIITVQISNFALLRLTPVGNLPRMIVDKMKKGWLVNDCDRDTTRVSGSKIHWLPLVVTHIDTTARTTKKKVK